MTTIDVPADRWHDAVAEAIATHPWLVHLTAIDGRANADRTPTSSSSVDARTMTATTSPSPLVCHAMAGASTPSSTSWQELPGISERSTSPLG